MAIFVVGQKGEPMSRLIDADALIVALKRKAPISDAMRVMWAECLEEVRHAPTIEPEQKWIPCSEKAHPDLPIRVQVQMNNGWIITAYYQDGDWLSVPNYGDVIRDEWIEAWRELPEPYREEGDT